MKNSVMILVVVMVVSFMCSNVFAGPPVISGVVKQENVYRTMIPSDLYQADFSIEEDIIDEGEWSGTWVVYYKKVYLPELKNLLARLRVQVKYESVRGLRDVQIEPIEELGDGFVCIPFAEEIYHPGGDIDEYKSDWAGKPAYIIVGEYVPVPPKSVVKPILNKASSKK